MKRYFSHYTFIYPDILLKNHVLELSEGDVVFYQYTHEIANTEFYSGLIICLPENISLEDVRPKLASDPIFLDLMNKQNYLLVRSFGV